MSIKISDYGYTGKWQGQVVSSTRTKASSFAAQMKELTDTMTLTDPAENPTLKAAYDQLSTVSKGVLDRLKAGQTDISQDEWTNLCRELKEAGIKAGHPPGFEYGNTRHPHPHHQKYNSDRPYRSAAYRCRTRRTEGFQAAPGNGHPPVPELPVHCLHKTVLSHEIL